MDSAMAGVLALRLSITVGAIKLDGTLHVMALHTICGWLRNFEVTCSTA
jgi:hypothetical protein